MDNSQQLVSWLALIAFAIVIRLVYWNEIKAILFNTPAPASTTPGNIGGAVVVPGGFTIPIPGVGNVPLPIP